MNQILKIFKILGSSTPGPQQNVGNAGFPPPNNNAGPPFQGGPNAGGPQMSFGSPSGASTPFGRPGKLTLSMISHQKSQTPSIL